MDVGQLGPAHGLHLYGGVELHRARAERDHRAVEGDVAVYEPAHVAHQLGLAVEGREDRVRQRRSGAPVAGGPRVADQAVQDPEVGGVAEGSPHRLQVGAGRGLVHAGRDGVGVHPAQVHARGQRYGDHLVGAAGNADANGVEELVVDDLDAVLPQSLGQDGGHPVHSQGDLGEAVGAVVDGVHRRHHRQQHLRRADVGRGLLAADVLLSGLQRQSQRRSARGVPRDSHQPARQRPLVGLAHGDVGGVGPAEAHRHPESLGGAHHGVGAHLAGRSEHAQRQRVGDDRHQRVMGVGPLDDASEVGHRAGSAGILHQQPVYAVEVDSSRVAYDNLEADGLGPGRHHGDGLGVAGLVDGETVAAAAATHPVQHGHGLGCGRGLVEQRGVGDVHAGQFAHHRLEVEQRFEPTLGDLGLVGRVGRVPTGVLEDVAPDDGGSNGLVVAHADHRHHEAVGPGHGPQLVVVGLAGAEQGQLQRLALAHVVGHGAVDELVHVGHADHREHLLHFCGGGADVAALERSPVAKVVEGWPGGTGIRHQCRNLIRPSPKARAIRDDRASGARGAGPTTGRGSRRGGTGPTTGRGSRRGGTGPTTGRGSRRGGTGPTQSGCPPIRRGRRGR